MRFFAAEKHRLRRAQKNKLKGGDDGEEKREAPIEGKGEDGGDGADLAEEAPLLGPEELSAAGTFTHHAPAGAGRGGQGGGVVGRIPSGADELRHVAEGRGARGRGARGLWGRRAKRAGSNQSSA